MQLQSHNVMFGPRRIFTLIGYNQDVLNFPVSDIQKIVSGTLVGLSSEEADLMIPPTAGTDSREEQNDGMFIAKPGDYADGHDFIEKSFNNGAQIVLAERVVWPEEPKMKERYPDGFPMIIVDDVVEAMGKLAAAHVKKLREDAQEKGEELIVVAVTGSAGKTTTKDLLKNIFSSVDSTVAPVGSYNGEVGVPLTVYEADESTRFLIVEMGATNRGNIRYLSDMVHPVSGAVLNVGTAHIGEFGGQKNIALTKAELIEDLPRDGYAIINLDDSFVEKMQEKTSAHILGLTQKPENFKNVPFPLISSQKAQLDDHGFVSLEISFPAETIEQVDFDHYRSLNSSALLTPVKYKVTTELIGLHHITNILAAAALAFSQSVSAAEIVQNLEGQCPGSAFRMERTIRDDGVTVINDAYNANPESMKAALQLLAIMGRARPEHKTWAVLGAMLELGEESIVQHDAIGRIVVRLNISKIIVVGQEAKALYYGAVMEGSWGAEAIFVETPDEAEVILDTQLQSGDTVLFKASNGVNIKALGQKISEK